MLRTYEEEMDALSFPCILHHWKCAAFPFYTIFYNTVKAAKAFKYNFI